MKFDIPINFNVETDNELEAEKLLKDICNDIVKTENKVNSWDFIEFIEEGYE